MPEEEKGKRRKADAGAAQTTDDFDSMLAEITAADLTISSANSGSTSSSTTRRSNAPDASGDGSNSKRVSDATILRAVEDGDLAQLQQWGRQGVRVRSAKSLCIAAGIGASLDVMRCLVEILGADVNGVNEDGHTPLGYAANMGNVDGIRYLVTELGADVSLCDTYSAPPLRTATQEKYLSAMLCLVKELGADVNQKSNHGSTAFTCSAVWRLRRCAISCDRSRGRRQPSSGKWVHSLVYRSTNA